MYGAGPVTLVRYLAFRKAANAKTALDNVSIPSDRCLLQPGHANVERASKDLVTELQRALFSISE